MPAEQHESHLPRRRRFARRERRRQNYLRLNSDKDGNLLHLVANAHELYCRLWNLENIVVNTHAQRCVAHYAELWCLNQLPLILGAMALAREPPTVAWSAYAIPACRPSPWDW